MPPPAQAARTRAAKPARPSTRRGRAAHNALSHGLRSLIPVIPGVESEEDWLAHLHAVVEECAPVGQIEILLVDRIALGFWRLKRVARYETLLVTHSDPNAQTNPYPAENAATPGSRDEEASDDTDTDEDDEDDWEQLEAEMPEHARDLLHRFDAVMFADESQPVDAPDALAVIDAVRGRVCGFPLSSFAVPGARDTPLTECPAWTGGLVRRTIRAICERFKKDPAAEISTTVDVYRSIAERGAPATGGGGGTGGPKHELHPLATHPLPPAHLLDRLVRYEAHLARDLRLWLSDLERWQARRLGRHKSNLDLLVSEVAENPISAERNGSPR